MPLNWPAKSCSARSASGSRPCNKTRTTKETALGAQHTHHSGGHGIPSPLPNHPTTQQQPHMHPSLCSNIHTCTLHPWTCPTASSNIQRQPLPLEHDQEEDCTSRPTSSLKTLASGRSSIFISRHRTPKAAATMTTTLPTAHGMLHPHPLPQDAGQVVEQAPMSVSQHSTEDQKQPLP